MTRLRLGLVILLTFIALAMIVVPGAPVIFAQVPGCDNDPLEVFRCRPGGSIPKPPPRTEVAPGPTRPGATPREATPRGTPTGEWIRCVYNPALSHTGYVHIYKPKPSVAIFEIAYGCESAPPPPLPPKQMPCPPGWSDDGIFCSWERYVEARIPPLPVAYTPYPRGIVYDRIQFSVGALITQAWQCSAPVDQWRPYPWGPDEDYRNFVLCLRWRQVKNPEPSPDPAPGWIRWVWDERAWGDPKETVSRTGSAEHTYVTSSAQKPENGPNGNLPSYQVQAHSFWVVDWMMTWEKRTRWYTCESGNAGDSCDGVSGRRAVIHERWDPGSDAGTNDLRAYGRPRFFADSTKIIIPDGRTMNILPVPVIEVQGVIGAPP